MFSVLLPSLTFYEDDVGGQGLYAVAYDEADRHIPDLIHATLMQRPASPASDASFGWNPTPYTW